MAGEAQNHGAHGSAGKVVGHWVALVLSQSGDDHRLCVEGQDFRKALATDGGLLVGSLALGLGFLGFDACLLLGFGGKGGDLHCVHLFVVHVVVIEADSVLLGQGFEDVRAADLLRVEVYKVVEVSVCRVLDLEDDIAILQHVRAEADNDLILLGNLDFGVGGRTSEQGIILGHGVVC